MAPAPAMMIMAEIGQRGEKPGGQPGVGPQTVPLLVQADERLGDEIMRIRLILQIPPGEREQGPLPPGDQFVERTVASLLQRL